MIDAFIIRMSGHAGSVEQAERCMMSYLKHGNTFPIEHMEAVVMDTLEWEQEGIEFKHHVYKANMPACTNSHYKLWKKAAETDKPVLVLEHDAVFLQRFTEDHLATIMQSPLLACSLYPPSDEEQIDMGDGLMRCTRGCLCQGYVIKPEGARAMIDFAKRRGYIQQHDSSVWGRHFDFLGGFIEKIVDSGDEWNKNNLRTSKTY